MSPGKMTPILVTLAGLVAFSYAQASYDYQIDQLDVTGRAGELGGISHLSCVTTPNTTLLYWQMNGKNLTADSRISVQYSQDLQNAHLVLEVSDTKPEDSGNYTCIAVHTENRDITRNETINLNITLKGRAVIEADGRAKIGEDADLKCVIEGFPIKNIQWKIGASGLKQLLEANIHTTAVNVSHVATSLKFHKVNAYENGTYLCQADGPEGPFNATARLYVLNKPNVTIGSVIAVGTNALYVNWTAFDGNEPIKQFLLKYIKEGDTEWNFVPSKILGNNSSFLIGKLEKATAYKVALRATNDVGESEFSIYPSYVPTLEIDPEFVPVVQVKGTTSDSVSIAWTSPRLDVKDYVHYYDIVLYQGAGEDRMENIHSAKDMDYLFQGLSPMTTYTIKIRACSDYTRKCGNWSREVNGTTLEGTPEPPVNFSLECKYDNISRFSHLALSWKEPELTYGIITQYRVIMQGEATYRDESGHLHNETYGPDTKTSIATTFKFENVKPNTKYTVKVAAMTSQKHVGKFSVQSCNMQPTAPDPNDLSRFDWQRVENGGRWLLRLKLPRISERNGPIACYIVYLVKLRPGEERKLPSPEEIPVHTYQTVKKSGSGAYIADVVDGQQWTQTVFLGDGNLVTQDPTCLTLASRTIPPTSPMPPTTSSPVWIEEEEPVEVTGFPDEDSWQTGAASQALRGNGLDEQPDRDARSADDVQIAYDGELDASANYTGFVEVLVMGVNDTLISSYSRYLGVVGSSPSAAADTMDGYSVQQELTIALHVLIGLVVVVCILLIVLFILHSYTRTVSEEQGIDMTFTNTLMHLCRQVGGRHVPVSSSPPDLPPIAKKDLPAAVAERHKDSDYGFQREFEMLPDRFPDRTTRASESRENMFKNRYPDIKAYDQTRVRLSLVDGSDYINANYVIGYKERKKFVCAQGPMDATINDFWRLVWEQNLEMILMLTNLEEYSKTKCAQYWPEVVQGTSNYGDLSVTHVNETRYADYLIRELKLKQGEGEERRVTQYHYLVWKDFMAPDNPQGILKFIRRINEAYSFEKGPILVHCSAGVGRTGTLVALDSLLQQLREEDQVAVFNTVCDLRHQRNFLVQSLKQYMFIYRALLEVSLTGDTEIKLSQLKSHIERIRGKENGKDRCPLQDEYDKLVAMVDERTKSWTVASNEENKSKNRNPDLLPLDRNRVMLLPIPGRDHSTYINASFIEGYESTDTIFITQDPMPNLLSDFWRMISEHSVHTIVMLSDLGEGKCVRYWPEPDDESVYDNIKVRYIQSESCPYYTRREFSVTNLKDNDTITTTQFQYNGWPTVEGALPEVTRGMTELVDQATESHQLALKAPGASPGPMAVHCHFGSDRSSIFTTLLICVAQLKTERAVDVFSVARKLRTQRAMMLDTFAEYDFVHRAILNYAELHHMTENGNAASPL